MSHGKHAHAHLLRLGDQARARIAAGEPASNLVSQLPGNDLSEGATWSYPHAKGLFSLGEAATWTAERVAEFEAVDRDHAEAMENYRRRQEAAARKVTVEQKRRAAMTPDECLVEDAILCSAQFRAFAANQ